MRRNTEQPWTKISLSWQLDRESKSLRAKGGAASLNRLVFKLQSMQKPPMPAANVATTVLDHPKLVGPRHTASSNPRSVSNADPHFIDYCPNP
jgi:hypothetical protein